MSTKIRIDEKSVHIIRHAFDDMKGYESENVIKKTIYDNRSI